MTYWLKVFLSFALPTSIFCSDLNIAKDLVYVSSPQEELKLDLYLSQTENSQLIVWVHGGAWKAGDKQSVPILKLTELGYSLASINYRLSPVAKFPAQVHDIKAAIRFLRAKASLYSYKAEKVVIAGASAGGHLAALVGVTNQHQKLEGVLGEFLEQSSEIHAIIDYYGPTNFNTILEQSTIHGLGIRIPALQLLLGGQPDKKNDLAKLASPIEHIDSQDPPLLVIHGGKDIQVPINQSLELVGKYKSNHLTHELIIVYDGGHGGKGFYEMDQLKKIDVFLKKVL